MALNADEKKLLEELQARMNEPDEDDSYEIEVYDTEKGKGARIPYRTGKSWLYDVFGIGTAPEKPETETGTGGDAPPAGTSKPEGGKGYFGRNNQG